VASFFDSHHLDRNSRGLAMKARPILFSGPMVRAILDGRKTQTRRVVKGSWLPIVEECLRVNGKWIWTTMEYDLTTPFGEPGDRLWVRETWAPMCRQADPICWCIEDQNEGEHHYVEYRVDTGNSRPGEWPEDYEDDDAPKWRPSIHMPRWASRITLEITNVRVEKLQEITPEDAMAEGVEAWMKSLETGGGYDPDAHLNGYFTTAFARMWSRVVPVDGESSWSANPWVWVIEFKRITT
jgi:hypothetical protein